MRDGKYGVVLGLFAVLSLFVLMSAQAVDRTESNAKKPIDRASTHDVSPQDSAESVAGTNASLDALEPAKAVPLPPGTVFDTYVVYPDGRTELQADGVAAPAAERVIYSDTLGRFVAPIPSQTLISDDISTTAPDGCALTRFTFQAVGRVSPSQPGGAYSIEYALYRICPGSFSQAFRPGLIIPGTSGTANFPDDLPHTISVVLPPNTTVPTNFYLGVKASRANVGLVVGSPPQIGLSCDIWDHPSGACASDLGGFPEHPHATLNAEFFAADTCPATFVGYRNDNPKQSAFAPGAFKLVADDIHLNTTNCKMVAYEVVVKGLGFYTFDLRQSCEGGTVSGTARSAQVSATNSDPQTLHFDFNPPINLPSDFLWFSAVVNNATAGVVLTGSGACTGFTDDLFGILDGGACTIVSPPNTIQEALNITITCQGSPPQGACCDMFVLDNQGDAVCRQVPEMNCPFPPRGSIQLPHWMLGAACSPNPFPFICGLSSCCAMYERPDPNGGGPSTFVEDCKNLSQNQCNAQRPHSPLYKGHCSVTTSQSCVDRAANGTCPSGQQCCPAGQECVGGESPILWQRGLFCGFQGQACPRIACLQRGEDCTTPHDITHSFGCSDAFCCDAVCSSGEDGSYCCDVEWDQLCVDLTDIYCDELAPSNDACSSGRPGLGARLLQVPGTVQTNISFATEDQSDPEFCCHTGLQPVCIGGPLNDVPCTTPEGCCDTVCGNCGECEGGPLAGTVCNSTAECCMNQQCGVCKPVCSGGPLHGTNTACVSDGECCGESCGVCPGRQAGPEKGLGSVWFKFVMPAGQTSAQLSTCGSSSPANDSLIQVFKPLDPTNDETACNSLIPLGCSDDATGCSDGGTNSKLCVRNLTPGTPYYAMLAAKTGADQENATYRLDIIPSCSGQGQVTNDFCTGATNIGEGVTPFNLANATPDCPLESCLPSMANDIWYNYTATCNGRVVIQTCGADINSSPNTGLAVYPGCTACPPDLPDWVGCSDFAGGACGFASKVTLNNVQSGQCFKVRLADDSGNPVSGNLTITCLPPCPTGSISADTPPNNVVDARRPFDPETPDFIQGIKQIKLFGPSDAQTSPASTCFSVCETTNGGTNNGITNIQSAPGTYTVNLGRAIWPGALAKIKYTPTAGAPSSTTYISHPGNVNGDGTSNSADVSALVARLGGGPSLPWGIISEDIDRSGLLTPLDLLDEIDILNGASGYAVWNGTTKATPNVNCP